LFSFLLHSLKAPKAPRAVISAPAAYPAMAPKDNSSSPPPVGAGVPAGVTGVGNPRPNGAKVNGAGVKGVVGAGVLATGVGVKATGAGVIAAGAGVSHPQRNDMSSSDTGANEPVPDKSPGQANKRWGEGGRTEEETT